LTDFNELATFAIAIIAAIALVISISAYMKQDKKSRFDALTTVFTLLNTREERDARKVLHEAHKYFRQTQGQMPDKEDITRNKGTNNKFPSLKEDVERIRADFDQIGSFMA
jgi:uncharacterized membrane protein